MKYLYVFILVHSAINNGTGVILNSDQVSSIGIINGYQSYCGNKTLIRFYNGDSTCINETPEEMHELIMTKNYAVTAG